MNIQQISFAIPGVQFEALRKRAGVLNIRPAEYAKRLFDAAYFVRVMNEKGEPVEDAELDRQVRQVFLLADCEPEYIAEAIGMPVKRAQRILDGWRQAARDLVDPAPRVTGPEKAPVMVISDPLPPPSPGAGTARDPRSERAWPAAMVETVRVMWAEGRPATEIAAVIGKKRGAIEMWVSKNRDVCPKRR
jgi:hypothetical protein